MDKFKKLVKETFEALEKLHFVRSQYEQSENYVVYVSPIKRSMLN